MNRADRDLAELLIPIARFGLAHSFFGQLYEAVVDVPGHIAAQPLESLFGHGSPTRYFLPTGAVTRLALLAAAAMRWDRPGQRPGFGVAVLAVAGEAALTAYLVRTVNNRLFVAGTDLTRAEQRKLLRRWHRLNVVRLVAAPVAWAGVADAAKR